MDNVKLKTYFPLETKFAVGIIILVHFEKNTCRLQKVFLGYLARCIHSEMVCKINTTE